MTRTLTALFDTRSEAEAARAQLQSAINVEDVHIHDQTSQGFSSSGYSSQQDRGFWGNIKSAFLPDEDRHTYEEGMRRGGFLLTAEVNERDADEACRLLESGNSVDLERRTSEWRSSGWDYDQHRNQAAQTSETGAGSGSAFAFGGRQQSDMGATAGMSDTGSDQRIPIVEEELRVGKREVARGGVRVRSYVVETPVSEQVTLRDENVSVERRAVDLPLSAVGEDAFREREIEMTETSEEAVVAKEARVREELVVHKEVGQRTETIQDSVRHTEVDVDDIGTSTSRTDDDLTRRDRGL
jgi:uncharacterized protein (TIGR02271 family)